MHAEQRNWGIAVGAAEPARQASVPFPCRGTYNRYTGCIGARRCRSLGVEQCILGRWPDERTVGGRTTATAALEEPEDPPAERRAAKPVAPKRQRPTVDSASPAAASAGKPRVAMVVADRTVATNLGRHLSASGYDPVHFSSAARAEASLDAHEIPAALLIDSALQSSDPDSEQLLDLAARQEIPVLSLPRAPRGQGNAEPAARMASLWLAVTLRAAHSRPTAH